MLEMNLTRAILISSLGLGFCLGASTSALAQLGGGAISPLGTPLILSAPQSPANVAPANGPLPPIGDGNSAQPVIPGDSASMPAASGTAQSAPVNGTNFPTRTGQGVQTASSIQNIPATRRTQRTPQPQPSGPHVTMNQASPAYPPYGMNNGRKTIPLDIETNPSHRNSAPFDFPASTNLVRMFGPTHTVRPFARFLVKLGVVFATVLMAFAAFSVVLGQRDGAARVVSTAGGLILLLMGYTIYKIVVIDTHFYGGSQFAPFDQNNSKPQNPSVPYATNTTPQMTNNAVGRGTPARTNQPAAPFASSLINSH
jgi:hypothetical protein